MHPGRPSRGSRAPQWVGSHLALEPDSTLMSQVVVAGEGSQLVYPEVASIGKNWPRLGLESLPSRTIPVAPYLLILLEAKLGPENKDSFTQPWTLGLSGGSKGQMEATDPSLHFPAKGFEMMRRFLTSASLCLSLSLHFSSLRRGRAGLPWL